MQAPRRSLCHKAGLVFRPAGFFSFLFSGAAKQWSGEPFFRSWTGFLHALDRQRYPSLHSNSTCTVSGHRHIDLTSDLSSCWLTPELGGALWRPDYSRGRRPNQLEYSSTLVHSVQSLYISCYVFSNKLVLSYLLLHLLPQYDSILFEFVPKHRNKQKIVYFQEQTEAHTQKKNFYFGSRLFRTESGRTP